MGGRSSSSSSSSSSTSNQDNRVAVERGGFGAGAGANVQVRIEETSEEAFVQARRIVDSNERTTKSGFAALGTGFKSLVDQGGGVRGFCY